MPNYKAGNLILHLVTRPHESFERRNVVDLHSNITISLLEALTGFSREVSHIDGRKVKLERSDVTQPGQTLSLPGQGLPYVDAPASRGTWYITVEVEFPDVLTYKQIEGTRARSVNPSSVGNSNTRRCV